MKKVHWIVATASTVIAVALLFLLVRGHFKFFDSSENASVEHASKKRGAELTLEEQTPRNEAAARAEAADEVSNPKDAESLEEAKEPPKIPPELSTVDGVLDELARLVVDEYDLWIQTHSHDVAIAQSHSIVIDRIVSDPEYAVLNAAMARTLNDFPLNADLPEYLLWRAGRIPISKVPFFISLPNGEIHNMERNTKVIVRFQTRGVLSADGRISLRKYTERQSELLANLAKGAASESEEKAMLTELSKVEQRLHVLHNPPYGPVERSYEWGDSDEGPFKEVVLDLGVVEYADPEEHARKALTRMLATPNLPPESKKELQRELDALNQ